MIESFLVVPVRHTPHAFPEGFFAASFPLLSLLFARYGRRLSPSVVPLPFSARLRPRAGEPSDSFPPHLCLGHTEIFSGNLF